MKELRLRQDLILTKPLDNWVADAGGSTARVFQCKANDYPEDVAIKIMSPAWILYSLPRFIEEIRIMCQIRDIKWATHPLEFGFLSLNAVPIVDRKTDFWDVDDPGKLEGTIRRLVEPGSGPFTLSRPEVEVFVNQLGQYLEIVKNFFRDNKIGQDSDLSDDEWLALFKMIDCLLPYIVFEKRGTLFLEPILDPNNSRTVKIRNWRRASDPELNEVNLLLLCDEALVYENLLPVKQGIISAIQICEIMTAAHQRNVAFCDHKILHYYWNNLYDHVFIIDWNMGIYEPIGLSDAEKKFDLIQFSARALFHILTGRQANGAFSIGRTEYRQLDNARREHATYQVVWKNGEKERLGPELVKVLEDGISGRLDSFEELKIRLQDILEDV